MGCAGGGTDPEVVSRGAYPRVPRDRQEDRSLGLQHSDILRGLRHADSGAMRNLVGRRNRQFVRHRFGHGASPAVSLWLCTQCLAVRIAGCITSCHWLSLALALAVYH